MEKTRRKAKESKKQKKRKKQKPKDKLERWFDKNTFHCSEFSNIKKLLKLKEEQNIKISVGIPTLNEQESIGKIIKIIKTKLMDNVPLIDEIVVIDSGSDDKTCRIAKKAGADVYLAEDYIKNYNFKGKGVNLWKSLFLLKGDIILWIDGDIKNMHPRFVYALVGPLLKRKDIGFVKAFYERPIKKGGKLYPSGGGRVTEILVKPLLNAFFPELSRILQPLSGEYAGKRSLLEKVPFFVGYGVETGLLIDIYQKYGLNAIAQVDILKRIHRNRKLPALKKMSFGILQAFLQRAKELKKIKIKDKVNNILRYSISYKGRYYPKSKKIEVIELPPMATIKEYENKKF